MAVNEEHALRGELIHQLTNALKDCSRQRLRALQMSLRSSATMDHCVSNKDLVQGFQDNHIKISSRTLQLIADVLEGSRGLNIDALWKDLANAQAKTGRDSVLAQNTRNDKVDTARVQTPVSKEHKDRDLVRRLRIQLAEARNPYDLADMRMKCKGKDVNKAGKIKRDELLELVTECQIPIYGALLTGLLSRCDEGNILQPSWPEFMDFLEMAQREPSDDDLMMKPKSPRPTTSNSMGSSASLNAEAKTSSVSKPKIRNISGRMSKSKTSLASKTPANKTTAKRSTALKNQSSSSIGKDKEKTKKEKEIGKSQLESIENDSKEAKVKAIRQLSNQPALAGPLAKELVKNAFNKVGSNQVVLNPWTNPANRAYRTLGAYGFLPHIPSKTPSHGKSETPTPGEPLKSPHSASTLYTSLHSHEPVYSQSNWSLLSLSDSSRLPDIRAPQSKAASYASGRRSMRFESDSTTMGDDDVFYDDEVLSEIEYHRYEPDSSRSSSSSSSSKKSYEDSANLTTTGEGTKRNEEKQLDGKSEIILEETEAQVKQAHTAPASPVPSKISSAQKSPKATKPVTNEKGTTTMTIKGKHVTMPIPDTLANAEIVTDPPKQRLSLEWVYGYSGNDCRSNIFVAKSGEIVYPIGSVIVLYNRKEHSQRHYREHTHHVKSIALHPNGITVASGQGSSSSTSDLKAQAQIKIWRCDTLQTLHILGSGLVEIAVIAISFSKAQDRVCAIDSSVDRILRVWDINNGQFIAEGKKYLRGQFITSLLHTEKGDLITGDSNGTVYVWGRGGSTITNLIKHAHNIPTSEGGVRMLTLHEDVLLIGTTTNSILTAKTAGLALKNILSGVEISPVPMTQGHFDVLQSMCVPMSPANPGLVLTAGQDGNICMFDTNKRQPLWKQFLKCRVLVFGVGTSEEEGIELQELCCHSVKESRSCVIKLSPECDTVAMGDTSGRVHLIGVVQDDEGSEHWEALASWQAHSGPVSAVDWSRWSENGKKIKAIGEIRNMHWSSHHCSLLYDVAGMWFSKQALNAQVTALDIQLDRKLLIMGDSLGFLSLFRYPCPSKGMTCTSYPAHVDTVARISCTKSESRMLSMFCHIYSSHRNVRALRATTDGASVLVIGGDDPSIVQWKISTF
ncbi:hypothetical protein CAPTEDRAFT_198144 [Capitella teleta]|uniref:EML-like first beta-propeller domain-containing protein n=1 Tax=Capitella teleta TaxID=283909 RepID=X1ZYB9_CAPTE|nr:hypothetical protein CAPTEDRAFT_198144 [Capitella teleta]|eukprot:ELU04693.1 hypothetical protein CAPTEDRAFT_198144 [Capitella teleta]